ncbi:hypothetical protein JCM19538_873 [Jejuia pallidilutea]|uniref:Uncharacterized protein n=1 Tax=Jejuia pallidilutea TaxID=504487 RepID=A0A098LUQ1_9FLAO|nr:hypothetical protein JCM19538_873 [Jejuia pallidilutea]
MFTDKIKHKTNTNCKGLFLLILWKSKGFFIKLFLKSLNYK